MVAAVGLLAILDSVIISPTPTTTRVVLAVAVTAVFAAAIVQIWRSNVRIERRREGKAGKDR